MNELDELLLKAYENNGEQEYANKFYVTFFRTLFYMPVLFRDDPVEPFTPDAIIEGDKRFIPVFSTAERLTTWADASLDTIDHVSLLGLDLLKAAGVDNVYIALNPGTSFYKEFAPDEITRLKIMIAKLDKLKHS